MAEINAAFSPDFKEFYYSITMPNGQLVIMANVKFIFNKNESGVVAIDNIGFMKIL